MLHRSVTIVMGNFPKGCLGKTISVGYEEHSGSSTTSNENWSYVYSCDQLCTCNYYALLGGINHTQSSRIDSVHARALEMQTRHHWVVLATPTVYKRKLEWPWPSWLLLLLWPRCVIGEISSELHELEKVV